MNTLFAIDYASMAEAERGLAQARTLQRGEAGPAILDAVLAHVPDQARERPASVLVLVAGELKEEAALPALSVLGGTIRHAAMAPAAGSRIRPGEKRPAHSEPEVAEAVAALDRG
ncbi:hypothetical protein [Labrys wisconsinensis]|uniref:Uncharacterized protein n=1 Tax=Labrys wisconsinensis TaxID=425677 RepID=A0ABU0J168_9HYPH|nr:hypothetical protein [Labrys wisconsinensis]MDQ0467188.1 hypothetical protein [Labrys wisconsinensis]